MTLAADDFPDLEADDPRPTSQRIASVVRAAILTGRLKPGDKLPSQLDLAERYGVARETVKSALTHLSHEQLINRRQGSGAYVRERTPEDIARAGAELRQLQEELAGLRAQLRRTDADARRVESRIAEVLDMLAGRPSEVG